MPTKKKLKRGKANKKTTAKEMKALKKVMPDQAIPGEILEDEEPDKFGRPTVVTVDVKKKLVDAFMWGCSNKEAALYAGICEKTLDNYNKKDPDFKAYCVSLKESPALKARITLIKSLSNPYYALKYLERKRPDEFGVKVLDLFEPHEPLTEEEQKLLEQAIDENL